MYLFSKKSRLIPPVFSLLMALAILLQTVFLPLFAEAYSPKALYDEVWRLIQTRYVDVDKNGQDWAIWRNRYDDAMQTDDDAYVAVETMLASLGDRYTRFLDPDEFAEEGRNINATLFGIGIQIGNRDGKLLIIAPIEDTPAAKAGLKANDEIIKIDATQAKGMPVKEAANLIRGERGSQVTLTIIREGKQLIMKVTRDEIKLKAVGTKPPFDTPIPKGVGYIKISSFLSSNTSFEVKNAFKDLADKQGYIIDLRSNPGGLLSNAVSIADFLLDSGAIVSTVDRDGYKEVRYATPKSLTDKPIVMLIDGGSASASEILSGALRDNNRAILVGQKSFGKGLVQEINQLPGGSGVNITTQRYLTPNDTDINLTGIIPDIEVKITEEDFNAKQDPQLKTALSILQDVLDGKSMKYLQTRSLIKKVPDASAVSNDLPGGTLPKKLDEAQPAPADKQ